MKYPIFTLLVLVHSSVISAEVKWDCFQLHEIASSWSGRVVGCYYYDQDALGNIL